MGTKNRFSQLFTFAFLLGLITLAPALNHEETFPQSSREPASDANVSCLKLIAQFYPVQDEVFVAKRMSLNADFHSFYRSFVPLYYEAMKNEKELERIAVLKKYIGMIAGDVHSENFGLIIDDRGKILFSINDYDDIAEAPLFFDVFRHFISTNIVTKDIDWKAYLKAYEQGLRKEKNFYSKRTQKNIDTAIEQTKEILKKAYDSHPPRFIKRAEPNRDMTASEISQVAKGLKEKFPEIQIYDQYARIKADGGSAGMERFHVLARTSPDGNLQWLDVKATGLSSYDKVFSPNKNPNYGIRLEKLKQEGFKGKLELKISTVELDGKTFNMRAINNFAINTRLDNVKKSDLPDLLLDEAYALGRFHANSLEARGFSIDEYLNDWGSISHSDLSLISDSVKENLAKLYSESK